MWTETETERALCIAVAESQRHRPDRRLHDGTNIFGIVFTNTSVGVPIQFRAKGDTLTGSDNTVLLDRGTYVVVM